MSKPLLQVAPKIASLLGYPWEQRKGQRRLGPPLNCPAQPPRGSEVFFSKIQRDLNEDDLFIHFLNGGPIYEMRLAMDLYGFNRGYGFVKYFSKNDAENAVKKLNGQCVRGKQIYVAISVDNVRLFVGSLLRSATEDDVLNLFKEKVEGVVDVIIAKDFQKEGLNRGFAFVEFENHGLASRARRVIMPNPNTRLGRLVIDWANPEPSMDSEEMKQIKALFIGNLLIKTTPKTVFDTVSSTIHPDVITRTMKKGHFAFVYFQSREIAEKNKELLKGLVIDGNEVTVDWARPKQQDKIFKHRKTINAEKTANGKYSDRSASVESEFDSNNNTCNVVGNTFCSKQNASGNSSSTDNCNESSKRCHSYDDQIVTRLAQRGSMPNSSGRLNGQTLPVVNSLGFAVGIVNRNASVSCEYTECNWNAGLLAVVGSLSTSQTSMNHRFGQQTLFNYVEALKEVCVIQGWPRPEYCVLNTSMIPGIYKPFCTLKMHIGTPSGLTKHVFFGMSGNDNFNVCNNAAKYAMDFLAAQEHPW